MKSQITSRQHKQSICKLTFNVYHTYVRCHCLQNIDLVKGCRTNISWIVNRYDQQQCTECLDIKIEKNPILRKQIRH